MPAANAQIMAGLAASSAALTVSIENIKQIATNTLGTLTDQTSTSTDAFRSRSAVTSSFSDYPLAKTVGTQHEAAREVFKATIKGVLDDLTNFQTQLLACAKEYENTDDAASAALAAVDRKFDAAGFVLQSAANRRAAIQAQGEALAGLPADQVQPEAAAPASESRPEAAPASDADPSQKAEF